MGKKLDELKQSFKKTFKERRGDRVIYTCPSDDEILHQCAEVIIEDCEEKNYYYDLTKHRRYGMHILLLLKDSPDVGILLEY